MIQAVLGHDKLDTTARYTRVATGRLSLEDYADRMPFKFDGKIAEVTIDLTLRPSLSVLSLDNGQSQ